MHLDSNGKELILHKHQKDDQPINEDFPLPPTESFEVEESDPLKPFEPRQNGKSGRISYS